MQRAGECSRRFVRVRHLRSAAIRLSENDPWILHGSSFHAWAEPWSRLGLWLSLWDATSGQLGPTDGESPFWQMLSRHSAPFRSNLESTARAAMNVHCCDAPADRDGISVLAVPVLQRRRVVGAVVVCALNEQFDDDEVLARLCSRAQLDRTLVATLARDLPRHPALQIATYSEILRRDVQSCTTGALARREVADLSGQLAKTYEELNLLYRLSTSLTALRRPDSHLEVLCNDMLGATVIQTMAAVLEPPPGVPGDPAVHMAGPCPPSADDIRRLYSQVSTSHCDVSGPLVMNDTATRAGFAWAASWLKQLIFVDLARGSRRYGALLAINHVRGEEFGSEEMQLISAVGDRSAAFLENVRLYADLEQLFLGMMHALVSSIDAKDPYTCGHSQRVAWLSRHIASLLGEATCDPERVYLSGLLHDVGKIGISESVLRKTGHLTPAEFVEMKRHPEIGARILEGVRQMGDVIPGVLSHHERMDGTGYPAGLQGSAIPLLGRIIGLADSFDAITTSRTYRAARTIEVAVAEIRRCTGSQFDPALVDLLLREDLHMISRGMMQSVNRPMTPCRAEATFKTGETA